MGGVSRLFPMAPTSFATTYPPLTPDELQELAGWSPDNLAYLRDRAANQGLSPDQLLAEFPADHRSEAFVSDVLPHLQISHIIPKNFRPDLADEPSNIVLELVSGLGGRNQIRQNNVMDPLEVLDVQLQTEVFLDARAAQLIGQEPLLLGHVAPAERLEGTARLPRLDPEHFSSEIGAATAEAGWQEGFSQMGEHVLSFLAEMGIPMAAVTARGAAALWPFLRSVDWKRFCTDWRYTMKTLNRAMRAWRDGGWKEACRALALGVMIAHVPHLATVATALGLAGIGALGVRWLASRRFMQNTRLGSTLQRIADALTAVAAFLRGAFQLLEKVVDVVIEGATRVVKRVATASSEGAKQVLEICTNMATRAFRKTRKAVDGATNVAATLSKWVTGWFRGPEGWASA